MSLKAIFFALGCLVAWFLLMPLFLLAGGVMLCAYAVFAELGSIVMGIPSNTLDTPVAREIARRMCGAYAVQARSTRRLPTP